MASSTLEIVLPDSLRLDLASGGPLGGNWVWDSIAQKILVKAEKPVAHAEPAALACLAAWASHQRNQGVELQVHESLQSPYLYRTGLLSALMGRLGPATAQTEHALPPTQITDPEEHSALFRRITPLLGLKDEDQQAVVLKCVGEILNNVHEHSDSKQGAYVSCSYFPTADRVSLAVVDTGRGVPSDIRRKHGNELSDAQALQAAIQWRVSGASATPDNAGIGLFYVRSAATHTGGQFTLISGTAQVKSTRPGDEDSVPITAPWKGTIVALSFKPSLAHKAWAQTEKLMAADLDNRKTQPVQWTSAPPGVRRLEIAPSAAGLVEDKSQARRLRDEMLLPEISAGQPVSIDLTKARLITHSFVHTLLHEAFRRLGPRSRELLYVQAKEPPVKDMIRIVARYAREAKEDDGVAPQN